MERFNLEELKQYCGRDKNVVFGFMRQMQLLLPTDTNPYYIIPPLVIYICLYYYRHYEIFTLFGDKMSINEANNIVKCHGNYNTVYGKVIIDGLSQAIHVWKVKILELKYGCIYVGIDSSNKAVINEDFSDPDENENSFYSVDQYGSSNLKWMDECTVKTIRNLNYEGEIKKDDCMTMKVNPSKKTIKYFKNEMKTEFKLFEDIDMSEGVKYHFAVAFAGKGSVQLIDYHLEPQ